MPPYRRLTGDETMLSTCLCPVAFFTMVGWSSRTIVPFGRFGLPFEDDVFSFAEVHDLGNTKAMEPTIITMEHADECTGISGSPCGIEPD
jgi:hypothetical protein